MVKERTLYYSTTEWFNMQVFIYKKDVKKNQKLRGFDNIQTMFRLEKLQI